MACLAKVCTVSVLLVKRFYFKGFYSIANVNQYTYLVIFYLLTFSYVLHVCNSDTSIYLSTELSRENDKANFNDQLNIDIIDRTQSYDLKIIMGYLHVQISSDNSGYEGTIKTQDLGKRIDNCSRLLSCCSSNGFRISSTCFKIKTVTC